MMRSRKPFQRCTRILNFDFFPRAFNYLLLQSLVKGGRPKLDDEVLSIGLGRAAEGRPLPMLDRLFHLRFQTSWLRPMLYSDRFPHQCVFQMILLHQARHINPMQVFLGPAFGGPWFPCSTFRVSGSQFPDSCLH